MESLYRYDGTGRVAGIEHRNGKGIPEAFAYEYVLKTAKTVERALERLEITYKVLSGKTDGLKRYLDEVAEMMRNACRSGPEYRLCFEGAGYYLDEGTELVFKIVDDAGESVSYARRLGDAAADGLDGVRDASRYVDEVV